MNNLDEVKNFICEQINALTTRVTEKIIQEQQLNIEKLGKTVNNLDDK